jgi:hypothetical protein
LLLYSSKPSLGVFQLAGHLLQANKISGTIITAPSLEENLKVDDFPYHHTSSHCWHHLRQNIKKHA